MRRRRDTCSIERDSAGAAATTIAAAAGGADDKDDVSDGRCHAPASASSGRMPCVAARIYTTVEGVSRCSVATTTRPDCAAQHARPPALARAASCVSMATHGHLFRPPMSCRLRRAQLDRLSSADDQPQFRYYFTSLSCNHRRIRATRCVTSVVDGRSV